MKAYHCVVQWLALLTVIMVNHLVSTASAEAVSFATNTYVLAGYSPFCIAAADVNGDGKLDLIGGGYVLGDNGGRLTVLTNNGSSDFGSNATILLNLVPGCIATADISGDGKPDLVCPCYHNPDYSPSFVWGFTNNGNGGFTFSFSYPPIPPGIGEHGILFAATADVNGDGKSDLVYAHFLEQRLTVLTNDGSGNFGSNATYTVGSRPRCVIAADIKGDGKMDLICANAGTNTLTVLTNNGGGVFGSNACYNVGSNPGYVAAADLNGDAKLDLVSANNGDNTLTVLTNNGSGGFGSNATLNVGLYPHGVVAVDVNGDGKLDLVTANYGANTVTVLTNNGSGVFGCNATLNVGSQPSSVIAADLNGDGKPDLVTADSVDGTLTVLINTTPLPAPTLNITWMGDQVALVWPPSATNYVLESTTNLSVPYWIVVTDGVPVAGGVAVTNSSAGAFFRLHQF